MGLDETWHACAVPSATSVSNMACSKKEQFISKHTHRISTDTRVAAQGGGHDHVEDLSWVPAEWRAKSYTPETLRSIGAPWILTDDACQCRERLWHGLRTWARPTTTDDGYCAVTLKAIEDLHDSQA